jgi:hypothetical protein
MDEFPFFFAFLKNISRKISSKRGLTQVCVVDLMAKQVHFSAYFIHYEKYDPLFRFINQLVEKSLGSKGKTSRLVALRSH